MVEFIYWPRKILKPRECRVNLVSFSRNGGPSVGGISPTTQTDLGWWEIKYNNLLLQQRKSAQVRTWDSIDAISNGKAGLHVVPIWAFETAPYVDTFTLPSLVPFSDTSVFSDGAEYYQPSISVYASEDAALGATVLELNVLNADVNNLHGAKFSYNHALYRIRKIISMNDDGSLQTVLIAPTLRTAISAGAQFNFDEPDCLCHLQSDNSMERGLQTDLVEQLSVTFVEATDYWNALATGLL